MRSERSHPVAIVVLLVLAVLAGTVAIASIWANQQLLSTGSWVSVSGRMLESKSVRHGVAEFLGEELASGTGARLDADQIRLAEGVMETKHFRATWLRANRVAHRTLMWVLDKSPGADEAGAVVLDLTPGLRQLAVASEEDGLAEASEVPNLAGPVEPGAGRLTVLEAEELNRAQDAVRVIRHLTAPAVIVALVLYAAAILLGRRRLSPTLVGVGLALAATGGLALLARALAGHAIVDDLLGGVGEDRQAADAAWNIATSKVADLAGIAIGLGAVIVLLVAGVAIFRKAAAQRAVVE